MRPRASSPKATPQEDASRTTSVAATPSKATIPSEGSGEGSGEGSSDALSNGSSDSSSIANSSANWVAIFRQPWLRFLAFFILGFSVLVLGYGHLFSLLSQDAIPLQDTASPQAQEYASSVAEAARAKTTLYFWGRILLCAGLMLGIVHGIAFLIATPHNQLGQDQSDVASQTVSQDDSTFGDSTFDDSTFQDSTSQDKATSEGDAISEDAKPDGDTSSTR